MLVAEVDESLAIGALAEALIDPEIADWELTPIDRGADVRKRHNLDRIDPEVGEVGNDVPDPIQVAAELHDVDFIENEVG
jgi:hypothetical protein